MRAPGAPNTAYSRQIMSQNHGRNAPAINSTKKSSLFEVPNLASKLAAFSKARNQPICRSCRGSRSSSPSISRPPRRSASTSLKRCWPPPIRQLSLVPLRVVAQHHTSAPGAPNFGTQVVCALKRVGADTDLVEGAGAAAVDNRAQNARVSTCQNLGIAARNRRIGRNYALARESGAELNAPWAVCYEVHSLSQLLHKQARVAASGQCFPIRRLRVCSPRTK